MRMRVCESTNLIIKIHLSDPLPFVNMASTGSVAAAAAANGFPVANLVPKAETGALAHLQNSPTADGKPQRGMGSSTV